MSEHGRVLLALRPIVSMEGAAVMPRRAPRRRPLCTAHLQRRQVKEHAARRRPVGQRQPRLHFRAALLHDLGPAVDLHLE